MTNRLKVFLNLLIVMFVLTACNFQRPSLAGTPGADQTNVVSTTIVKTSVSTKVPEVEGDIKKLDGLQIHFLHPWTGETLRAISLLVDEFNQSNEWGIHVIVQTPGSAGAVTQEFHEGVLNNNAVDLVAAPVAMVLSSDVQKENILDLNPYVLSEKYGFSEIEIGDFLPAFWDEDVVNGKRYGIPAQRTAAVLFYNSTWAAELSHPDIPDTIVDFRKQVCSANAIMKIDNDRDNDAFGGWIVNKDAITMLSWLNSFGALPANQAIQEFESIESSQAFEYLFQLQRDSCAWTGRSAQPYDYFTNRLTLAYSGTMQDVMKQTQAFERSGSKDKWTILAYPADGDKRIMTAGSSYVIIKSDPERQLAAWLFIRWMSSPEHQARLLQTSGTLPLSSKVLSLLTDFRAAYPQWNEVISMLPLIKSTIPQANSEIINTVLEDAGWQLFGTELNADQIPALLKQLDETILELSERTP